MKALRVAPLLARRRIVGFLACALCCALLPAGRAPALAAPPGAAALVVQNYVDAFNKHDLNAAMALVADDFVEVFPDGNIVAGKDQQRSAVASVFAGSPHVTMIMDHLVGDDFTAAAQVSIAPSPPKGPPEAAQYAYFFSVVNGKILAVAVYGRSSQAQKAAGAKS
ncbi:MAG TPA: nuclear transport factor 2 family protein [Candidatus Eremiobacteraceae bacterium]|nr:nuclear transport factor 2 family protein [Candidatus Eremiobacteraceae bacterium]